MKSFNYNTKPQEQSVEEILQSRKKRLFKQQIIFTAIFIVILAILAGYVYRRLVYTYYDGYVKLDQNSIRAVDNIFVLDIYKQTGDRVQAGDTLFSYVLIDNILEQNNVNVVPGIVSDLHKMQVQAELARQEIPVLEARLAGLRKRLANEANDVFYGLSDNSQKMMLQAEITEMEARLREQRNRIALYQRMAGKASRYVSNSGYGSNFMPYAPNTNLYSGLIKYSCAPHDAIVTDVAVAKETIVFHKENIIDLQPADYSLSNLGIMGYVPSTKVNDLMRRRQVDIIINDDITLKARMTLLGIRVEEIPKHLLSNFDHDVDAVVAFFNFLPGQEVPFWVLTDNLPVRIRVDNFAPSDSTDTSDMYYIREHDIIVPLDSVKNVSATEQQQQL